ncbi:MAG: amino acid adenylation domain-containing protein, partial [Acidobacteriota bacterium]
MRPGSTPPESLHPEATPELDERSVAVVGMSGRFPGAADVDAFWENLKHGVEAITRFSQDELRSAGVDDAELTEETYVKARGVLSDIEWFDAGFFGLSTREAQILDPQHRALLECAHQALEHAGYDPTRFDGLIGVYAGSGFNTYLLKHLVPHPQLIAAVGEYQVMLGNDKDFLPSRISYSLDLKGPSFTVQAGCSTSLVAAHLGCMSLINYDCDLALAGGVSINLPQVRGYRFKEGGIFSPDGHCQPFGPHARGTVPGSGAGLVVLKRLQEAYDDGDTIYAVIRGSAVNNDGSDKLGFTAPGPRAQTEAIIAAQEVAAVAPETIGYLESHGTGTAIGDPIELQSLTQAFRAGTEARRFCALGALKSSIGHPDTAAGIASLIKTALALHHRQIPPSVAGHSPGDQDHLAETPFYLTPDLHDWPAPDAAPRRAGISAFGIGGTNVHAILEEAPPQRPGTAPRPAQLLVLSARSAAALDSATRRIGRHLRQQPAIELADVAHTLQVGRRAYEFRRALVAGDTAQVLEGLETSRFFDGDPGAGPPEIAFLIPGQGTQYAGMGRSLYACESVYRQAVDRCTATLQAEIGLDLRTLLHPAEGQESAASELLEQTRYAQPALFTVAYALAEQWRSWGIEPAAVLGHSLGEYVAACLAGVFSLTDALELVATRGRLVQQLPRGGMLAIALSEAELRPQLVAGASLVALNGPRLCTVAGTLEVIEELEAKLRGRGVEIRRLHTSHAFHSPVMDPILSEYGDEVAKRSLHPARLPIVSNVSGDWAQPDELATPDYWVEQLRRPVRFADGIRRLLAEPRRFFVEVGPGNTLGRIAHSQLAAPSSRIASSLGGPRDRTADFDHLLESLGRLWTHGAEVDWQGYRGDARRRRIALPTYPFERRRLWVDPELGPLPIEDQTKRPAEKPAARAAPRNNLEQQLADLWEGVLGTPPTLEDDFFELGGHSLLASQLLSRIHDSLNVQLEVRALFEAPTLAGLAAAVAAKLEARDVPPPPPIAPLPRARPLPLSAAQQRLWFLDQLLPGNPAYNMALALRLTGALRPAALHAAIDHLVARHEILRTAIVAGDAGPRQQPLPARRQPLPIVDLGHLTGARREALARRLAMERRDSTFDLASGEVLRCLLIRLAESDHLVVFATHHIVLDGSQELFVERLTTAYRAATSGDSMAPVAVDYADYAQWEQSWLESEAVEQQLAFWRDRLGNESPPVLELPTDRPRPAIRSWRGDSVEFHLAEGLRQQLKAVCQERGATLYMTLLAALQTLLYRLTEQRSIWIGSPMINRPIPAQGVLGCFMNTVVLAATVNAKLAFEQLIDTTRRDALDAFSHREVPFERLVQALQPDRDLARTPLFQVMFTAMDLSLSRPRLELSDLEVDFPTLPSSHARFDLLTSLTEGLGEGLAGFIEFDAEIFDSTTIERFASAYRTLLTAVAERPATPLGELPLLGPAERHQLVAEWNDTATGTASVPRLESLFEAQASRRPDAMALECDGAALSYGELARRASALADRLAGQGVTAETPVAVFLERSPTMVIALLGILEAGGAYVPLSLGDPPARRQSIIETLGIRHLTTDSRTATAHGEGLRQQGLEHIVRVDRVGEAVTAPRRARGDDRSLAYTLFTSGSTGTPKGVMVRHRPASRLIRWVNDTFSVGSDDRILFLTSLGFDLSVYDVFGLLAAGGTVRIVSDQDLRDPSRQLATLGRERVTFWDSAPAALQQLMPLIAAGEVVSHYLRRIFLSGDWIPVALPEPLSSAFPSADLISLGGATEATVWSNFFPVERVDPQWISIPYGEPITDARYHVLDSRREPCPVGVPGDLFIGGACLASGYAARPELTAASFQPDGLTDRPGQRLYRTGDRARYWADGTLEFLGRLDQQVKIRGFRIELGEIETVLAQHETVRAAVVLARQDPPSAKRLVAYVVGRHGTPDEAVLAEHLRRHLPEYMVPTAWVALAELPLTANGKLDRQALPAPRTPEEDPGEVALSPMEDLAAGLWRDLLSVRRIAPGDDFFELGGDSLLVTRLISRVRESLAAEIEVRQLFEAPTLAGFAATLEAALDLEAAPAAPPIERVPDAEPALSFAQERLWFLGQLQPESSAYNIGAAVRIHGRLEADHLAAALVDLCQRHEPLRTTIHTNGSELRQQIADTAGDLLRVVDLRAIGGPGAAAEQHAIGRAEVERPFDLADGSPLRVTLLRLEAEQHLAFFTLHHIAGDGWSMGILLEELAALYRSRVAGRPAALPRLPVRYSDFAAWQRRWLSGEVLERQLAYWRQALAGAPTVLELPADRPRPPLAQYRGATYGVALDADVSRQLRQLSQTHGLTLFMTLLTAFKVLLLRHTRQRDVVVGSPIAGRNRTEIEGLIGLFVNSLVLRTDLQRNPSFGTALQRVRRTALGAYAHQDLPFERLVDELRIERDLSHSPLFQALFQLQPNPLARLELPGLTLVPVDLEVRAAKLDLVLSLEEDGEEIRGLWRFNTDLFDPPTIARLSARLQTLVAGCLAQPENRIEDLPLLSAAEHAQLVGEWNDTDRAYPAGPLFPDGFAALVARHPEHIAIVFEGQALSYGELARQVERVTRHLRQRGCGPESRVAVCIERCPELVIALLAILEAGGAYVPLDPAYPAERLAFMLADSGAQAVLSLRRHADLLPAESVPRLWLDERVGAAALGGEIGQPHRPVAPSHPAYVLYTSGSTGRPKGVIVSHGAIANRLLWMQDHYRLRADDRVLQKTPVSFDVSVWEFFWPLCSGAQLVLARPDGHGDGAYLTRLIADERITFLHFVPSMLQAFLEASNLAATRSLRRVIASGEALGPDLAQRFYRCVGGSLDNLYGPTEAAVDVTYHPTTAAGDKTSVPIGRPIANTRIHLLDRRMRPTPIGVSAELLIGGVNLARGYLGRPALTAERFVPDPLARLAGERLYRTGDLARHRADGAISYLGRLDNQVKLRGFRIELGEIEAVLAQDPTLREAAVVVGRQGRGNEQLVAYVVARDGAAVFAADLRRRLAQRLPDYMVPARIIELEELPLAPNGKLDRRALPAPDEARADLARTFVAPRNALEQELTEGWQELLGAERIGVEDDFFELGGNSIVAAIFVNRLQEKLGRIIHVVALFDAPTVAAFADYMRDRYPEAVAETWGEEVPPAARIAAPRQRIDAASLAELRRLIPAAGPLPEAPAANPRAVFVLSPPRSGSTLLRVMLAGHSRLFAPPELELLSFATLVERQTALTGRYSMWLEGVLRAIMEARRTDAGEARQLMDELVSRGLTTQQFYGRLQSWIGDRILVDKTSTYALDVAVLERAEAMFRDAVYIHLLRHPCGMIRSFEEAQLDEIFLRQEHRFDPRQLAELVWAASHQNIRQFLPRIPASRQVAIAFEDLVRAPQATLERLCQALDLPFEPAMLQPYAAESGRMSDGLHTESRMLGDVKFHQHRTIDPAVAD